MANDVIFEDFSINVKSAIDDRVNAALEECAAELESQTKRNSRVDTGKTNNSFQHIVDKAKHIAYIGSNYMNAIWEEYGTGEYSIKSGRKGGWTYKDEKGEFHHTYGKTPSRAFWKAFKSTKTMIIRKLQDSLKGL